MKQTKRFPWLYALEIFNFYIFNDIYEQQTLIILSQKCLEITHLHAFPIAIDISLETMLFEFIS